MSQTSKRLRVIAGPNGSGKSTVFEAINAKYNCGPFVNADLIEQSINEQGRVDLSSYNLNLNQGALETFLEKQGSSWLKKATKEGTLVSIEISNNNLIVAGKPNAYDAAIAADFIRHQLLDAGYTFTFETVLSHPSKIDFITLAKAAGYKTYLYFVSTVAPEINIARVQQRVKQGGHFVPESKIIDRYNKSLSLLPELIKVSDRCFLFDNSADNEEIVVVAEIEQGTKLTILEENVPQWIEEHVIISLFTKK